jgi:ankyrin repeat protein
MESSIIQAIVLGSRDALLDALSRGGNSNDCSDGVSAVALTCLQDRHDLLADLIVHGARVDSVMADGMTALHLAAAVAGPETARLLVDSTSDVNVRNEVGQTPLMLAAQAGNVMFAHPLLEVGADASLLDKDGRSVLHWAAIGGDYPEFVRLLLVSGADPSVCHHGGQTAADYARALGRNGMLEALLQSNSI